MNIPYNTLFRTALLATLCLLPSAAYAESKEAPKKVQMSDEQHKATLVAELPIIVASEKISLMNWHRDRAGDENEGWVKMELTPEQVAEVKPIFARMKMNPKASLKPTLAGSCGYNMPITNWVFMTTDGKPIYVSMTYDMTADASTGADWLFSKEDMASLTQLVDKYIKAKL